MLEFLKIGSKFLVPFSRFVGTALGYGGLLRRFFLVKGCKTTTYFLIFYFWSMMLKFPLYLGGIGPYTLV